MHVMTQRSSNIRKALLAASLALAFSTPGLAQAPAESATEKPAADTAQTAVRQADIPKVLSEEEKAQASKRAREERAREREKERIERERKCVTKPVMTDAEIDYCKNVRRETQKPKHIKKVKRTKKKS